MRKLNTLLTALALTLGFATGWAQTATDVTDTYISDPGFENGEAATGNTAASGTAHTKGTTNGGWTYLSSAAWCASDVVAYGGTGTVNNAAAPSTDNAGKTGKTLGISVGWGSTEIWKTTDNAKLPAGKYQLTYYGFNNNSGATYFLTKVGFVTTGNTSHLGTKSSFTYNQWESETVTFTLTELTEGYFQVGGTAKAGEGSGSSAKVFFDNLTLTYNQILKANDVETTYGTAPTFTNTFYGESTLGDDDVSYALQDSEGNTVTADGTLAVGTYTIVPTYNGSATNVITENGTLTVNAATVKIKVKDATMTEYGTMPDFTYEETEGSIPAEDVTLKATWTAYDGTTAKGTCDIDVTSAPRTYPITATTDNTNYTLVVTNGELTVNAKEYEAEENLGFSTGDAISVGVATYIKDTAGNGTTRSGLQSVPCWTASTAGNDTKDGDRRAGGLYAINSDAFLGGKGYTAPKTLADGSATGNVLGLVGVWGGDNGVDAYYSTTKALEAGTYVVTIPVYNAGGTTALKENYTGITCGEESATAETTTYEVGQWITEELILTIATAGKATIKLGGLFANAGSNNAPHLFFGPVTIEKKTLVKITVNDAEMTEYGEKPNFTYTVTEGTISDDDITIVAQHTAYKDGNANGTCEIDNTAAPGTYVLTAKTENSDYVLEVTDGKLTVSAKEYTAEKNRDFSEGDAISIGVATYDYDTANNGTTRSGLQTVPCWEANVAGNSDTGNARAGGLYTAGSDAFIGSTSYKAPESAPEGSNMLLGTMSVWGQEATYTTTVSSLPADTYILSIPVYNTGNTSNTFTNKIGYKIGEGDFVYATAETYSAEWNNETFTFTLTEAPDVTISLGLAYSGGSSNNGAPCLFFGPVTLDEAEVITRTTSTQYGTICYPYAVKADDNTVLHEVQGYDATNKKVVFTDETTKEGVAGKPYIYETTNTNDGKYVATFTQTSTENVEPEAASGKGLFGVLSGDKAFANFDTNNTIHIVQGGKWKKLASSYWTDYNLGDNRAFIFNLTSLDPATYSSSARSMSVEDGTTTGIDGATLDAENGDIYNLRGQKVTRAQKGVYIQNGKKIIK